MKKLFARIISLSLAVTMLTAVPAQAAEPQTPGISLVNSKMEGGSFTTNQIGTFRYLLYTPKNPTDNMPLVVYLHGNGPQGTSLESLWKMEVTQYLEKHGSGNVPAYVLIPLLPGSANDIPADKVPNINTSYVFPSGKFQWIVVEPALVELINSIADQYKIDRNRISLMGNSAGAEGCAALIGLHPEMFCGAVLNSPFYTDLAQASYDPAWVDGLKQIPTWFLSETQGSGPVLTASVVDSIKAAGGTVWYDRYEGSHGDLTKKTLPNANGDPVGSHGS